jgi:NitT/TauT family transport system permease protein
MPTDPPTPRKEGEAPQGSDGTAVARVRVLSFVHRHENYFLWLAGFLSFIVAWWVLAIWEDRPYLPTPPEVIDALFRSFYETTIRDTKTMWDHIAASLSRVAWGFFFAIVLAVPIGYMAGYYKTVENFINPAVELLRPVPPIAWLPFAIVFFHTAGDFPAAAVFIIFLGIFFPVLTNTVDGVKGIDKLLFDAALTLGARGREIFQKIVLPASIPSMMTGIRIGLGVGWMTIVAAEMTPVFSEGLGWYIWDRAAIFKYDDMFAGMLMIGIIGIVMFKSISYVERWVRR